MSRFPRIKTGLGKLTPEVWERGADLLEYLDRHRTNEGGRRDWQRQNRSAVFLAVIRGYNRVTPGEPAWYYAWREVEMFGGDENIPPGWDGIWRNGLPVGLGFAVKSGNVADEDDPRSSTIGANHFAFPALNLHEIGGGGTGSFFGGYNLGDPALPTNTFSVKPVRNSDYPNEDSMVWSPVGDEYDGVVVRMQMMPIRAWAEPNVHKTVVPVFSYPNAIYPECPAT